MKYDKRRYGKRFWDRKTLLSVGFKVLGLDFGGNNVYNFYVQYYPASHAILIFDAYENIMNLYKLSPEDYNGFKDGKFSITYDKAKDGRRNAFGSVLKYLPANNITAKTKHKKIERINHMKEAITIAELIVETNLIQETK